MTSLAADICLYGTRKTGFSFLAECMVEGRREIIGDSAKVVGEDTFSATLAAVTAVARKIGHMGNDHVQVFEPGGRVVATLKFQDGKLDVAGAVAQLKAAN